MTSVNSSYLSDHVDVLCLMDVAIFETDCITEEETAFAKLYNKIYNTYNQYLLLDREVAITGFQTIFSGTTDANGKILTTLPSASLSYGDISLYGIRQKSTVDGYEKSEKVRYFRVMSDPINDDQLEIMIIDPSQLKLPEVGTLADYDINRLRSDPNYIFTDVIDFYTDAFNVKQAEEDFETVKAESFGYRYRLINYSTPGYVPRVPNTGTPQI